MLRSQTILKAALPVVAVVLCGAALITPAEATQPSWQSASAAMPAYYQSTAGIALPFAPAIAPVTLGIGTSAMPPGPNPGTQCSTFSQANFCSSQPGATNLCSATNNNGNQCSTFGVEANTQCSVSQTNGACSVLPPSSTVGQPSECSTFGAGQTSQLCSAIGTATNMRCSTKGRGQGRCSTLGQQGTTCSVLNVGANQRSFCSTKLNVQEMAKACSAFHDFSACSVGVNGKGVCTTFGAALPGSCSAFAPNSHCSVIGGAPGNPCVQ